MSLGILKLYRVFIALFLLLSLADAKETMEFDFIKKGVDDNNTLLIVGGIQGDEPGGFISASLIATHYDITKGSVWIVPNLNFYSIIKRSRGPYGDMNRKFAYLSKKDPDYKTIQRVKEYIKHESVKVVINLHDGSGFYRPTFEDKQHSPRKWGQCSIIDQSIIDTPKYSNLEEISNSVIEHVNKFLLNKEDKYHLHNTRTVEGDKEMEKTLTYFAINNNKSAFGNEASKNLPTHKRVYYHLLALEKYMQVMGIEYKRKFRLTSLGVYNAINNDISISFYDNKIQLPLAKIRDVIKYFPISESGKIEFQASSPLLTIVKSKGSYVIHYGNRRLSKLKADYQVYDEKLNKIEFIVDGKSKKVEFGAILNVKKRFLVKKSDNYRVNIIGYKNRSKVESGVHVTKHKILKSFSVDKKAKIYRVEFYNKKKFAGMILVRFI